VKQATGCRRGPWHLLLMINGGGPSPAAQPAAVAACPGSGGSFRFPQAALQRQTGLRENPASETSWHKLQYATFSKLLAMHGTKQGSIL
jgi:hypothetical protein